MKKIFSMFIAVITAACLLCGCGSTNTYDIPTLDTSPEKSSASDDGSAERESKKTSGELDGYTYYESDIETNYVKIEMTDGDVMLLQLCPDDAPITVANFQKLVKERFYDGLIFHRVIESFVIQGGDPEGNGTGGSDENIKGEFSANGVENNIKHVRGVISMARSGSDYDSASSQFFIVTQTSENNTASLDGKYAAFGMMIAGWDTLDEIASCKVDSNDKPVKEQKINTIRFVVVASSEASSDESSAVSE